MSADNSATPFDAKGFLAQVSEDSGVYRMYNSLDEIIYVGKAKNLKKRLSSYFRARVDSAKTQALVKQIARVETTVTHSETEALILEHNLIKTHLPRYNVLLRDDKSYPYILISEHIHPRIGIHRGAKRAKGQYFGPYPNGGAVHTSLQLMQKLFPIRQCRDSEYANRSRPCLQYQLKRCSGPCVAGLVSNEDYQQQVKLARMFLQGKGSEVIEVLVDKMMRASDALDFEKAAQLRDQIASLRQVQEQQFVTGNAQHSDVLGFSYRSGLAVVHVLMIREGQVLGSRSYYPKVPSHSEPEEVLRSFVLQYYLAEHRENSKINEVLLPFHSEDWPEIASAISQAQGRSVKLSVPQRGEKQRFVALASKNAQTALTSKLNQQATIEQRFIELENLLKHNAITRMECFDISHTQGEKTVASCVVFNREGPLKTDYRRFNIEGITGGDDYAAMAQAISRRYVKAHNVPEILLIDGGKGQLGAAQRVIDTLNLNPSPLLIGVAKGVTRKAGLETLLIGKAMTERHLEADSLALHLIQHIRDESHRFAITGHRNRRDKARKQSVLEQIPGVGAKRRQSLLQFMGGIQQLRKASVDELAKVPGISKSLAQIIYDALHH